MKQVHSEDPQILGVTVNNLVTIVTWSPVFVCPLFKGLFLTIILLNFHKILCITFFITLCKEINIYSTECNTLIISPNIIIPH